jgi:hypothetical protein
MQQAFDPLALQRCDTLLNDTSHLTAFLQTRLQVIREYVTRISCVVVLKHELNLAC